MVNIYMVYRTQRYIDMEKISQEYNDEDQITDQKMW